MNVSFISNETFAQTISEADVLTTLQGPGVAQIYVCERDGADILIITDSASGGAIVVHPCNQDSDSGGSIHDHARASIV